MATAGSLVALDGSHGEGGGGLFRTALAMSALTQQSVKITGIRSGTAFPGMDVEDVVLARALATSCDGECVGLELGSDTLVFHPTARPCNLNGQLEAPEGPRKANALVVLSSLLGVLGKAGAYSSIACSGETYGANALTYDYFANVSLYACRKMGLYAFTEQARAGFGRESDGLVTMDIEPSGIDHLDWGMRGKLVGCKAVVSTSQLPSAIGQRGVAHLSNLAGNFGLPIEVDWKDVPSDRPGAFVTVWALYEHGAGGATSIGQKGLRVEALAQSAFQTLTKWMETDSTVDPHLPDQILIPAVLAEGDVTFKTSRLTSRFLTSVWVVKQFLPIHLTVRGKEDGPGVVTIRRGS